MRSVFVMVDLNYCEQFASMEAAKKVTTYLSRTLPDFLNFLAKSKETVILIVKHLFSIGFWFECTVTPTFNGPNALDAIRVVFGIVWTVELHGTKSKVGTIVVNLVSQQMLTAVC